MSEPAAGKRRVLILCLGNIARSQMAEAWWRHYGGQRWDVFSAGTRPRNQVHPLAIRVMGERGIDLRAQQPKSLDRFVDQPFDLVLTVCAAAERECPVFPHAVRRACWPVDDPAIAGDDPSAQLAIFRRIRDELAQRIRAYLDAGST